MKIVLFLLGASAIHACIYDGKKMKEGETFVKADKWKVECNNGAADVVACLADDKTEVPVGTTKLVGDYEWKCFRGEDGKTHVEYTPQKNADCSGGHKVGSEWIEKQFFKFKCLENRTTKVIGCIKNEVFTPVDETRTVNGITYYCERKADGTVQSRAVADKVSSGGNDNSGATKLACTDSAGNQHEDGSTWVEKEKFVQKCDNGYQRTIHCQPPSTKEIIPMNGKLSKGKITYYCENTNGTIQFYSKLEE